MNTSTANALAKIPEQGMKPETILEHLKSLKGEDVDWEEGKVLSLVYHLGQDHSTLLEDASLLYFFQNYLNPLAFKSLKQLESEVVRMTAHMLHGGPETVGCMTSGGTESILLAVLAARERARKKKPWIRTPEVVAPASIHVAFDKAAHLFGLRVVRVPLGPDYRADLEAMERHISPHTVLIAASAPQFPQGVIDPIRELAELALKHKLPFHVDSCIGGFMLPWLERLGEDIPPFDFRVPGVTSISADVHKYGYGAKGASTLLYRSMEYMRYQFFVATDWSGGMYVSPTLAGTRSGAPIAAAWAALTHQGEEGYLRLARQTLETTRRFREGIASIPELEVVGNPQMTLVAYTSASPEVNILAVADQMEHRGWLVDRQQHPDCIHLTIMAQHKAVIDRYLEDLRASVAEAKAHPELAGEGSAAMYGLMAKVPLRGVVHKQVQKILEQMYSPEGVMPDFEHEPEEEDFVQKLTGHIAYPMMGWFQKLRVRIHELKAWFKGKKSH